MVITSTFIPSPASTISASQIATNPNKVAQPLIKTETGIQFPVNDIKVTQGYSFYHPALDLDGLTGDPIYSIMAGKVEVVEYSKVGYGLSVIVNHGNGFSSRYAHLSQINVTVGQQVDKNTILGKMGATGLSFGDHLHLEIYEYGKTVNPFMFLPK